MKKSGEEEKIDKTRTSVVGVGGVVGRHLALSDMWPKLPQPTHHGDDDRGGGEDRVMMMMMRTMLMMVEMMVFQVIRHQVSVTPDCDRGDHKGPRCLVMISFFG